jgi:hypothetical protein
MKMKKTLMALVLAASMGAIGLQQASAHSLDRTRMDVPHRQFHQPDEATKAKINKFQTETQELRKQIVMKRAEELALIRSENPDMAAVTKTAGELFDLRAAMQEKAKAAGLFTPPKDKEANAKIRDKASKVEGFMAETKDLRKQVFVKLAEERALLHSKTPDAQAVAKVSGELFDLRTTLREKAEAAGIERGFFRRFDGEKMGPGRHFAHDRGFGWLGDDEHRPQGPDRGGDPLFAGE